MTVLFMTVLFVPCSQAAAGGLVAYEGMGPAGISALTVLFVPYLALTVLCVP